MRRGIGWAALVLATCAGSAAYGCPASGRDLPPDALYGEWEARIEGMPGTATLRLEKHPDYAGVRGTITRPAGALQAPDVAQLAGDLDDEGLLGLDESRDGSTISATWTGEMRAGTCGRAFTGTWRNAADERTRPFVLNRSGSW